MLSARRNVPRAAPLAVVLGLVAFGAQGNEMAVVPASLWRQAAAGQEVDCLVVMRPGSAPEASGQAAGSETSLLARLESGGARVTGRFEHLPIVRLRLPGRLLDDLAKDPQVVGVSPIRVARALRKEGKALMKVGSVQARGFRGEGIGIAVLDTGVDYGHSELSPGGTGPGFKTVKLFDAIDNDQDPRDRQGHGTSVAGIAAGSEGGVAPRATVVAVRVLDKDGEGSSEQILAGVDAVLGSLQAGNPYNIRVLNMSLGGYGDDWPPGSGTCDAIDPAFAVAFDALAQAGVLTVVASGNGGCSTGVSWPACMSSVLAVGAVYDDEICMDPVPMPFGCQSTRISFGESQCMKDGCTQNTKADRITCYTDSGSKLGVWAPSHCAKAPKMGGGYEDCFGGTSAAAPYASGVAALLAEAYPRHLPAALRAALEQTGNPRLDARNNLTRNRVDALAAFDFLATYCTPPATPSGVRADPSGLCGDRTSTYSWDVVEGADRYLVQRSTAPDFTAASEVATTSSSIPLSHAAATPGTLHLRVRAERTCGSLSAWSPEVSVPYDPECGRQVRRRLSRQP
ncbi:MAG TPA: S8 family serine peptidase [Thermoanaerobaculaceae bacterium]|nr:S8 family serine peptidase [Thermoanaerobaculaceae bacterium]HPS78368.1 S8 family serine peptidase [Thermoanaerobaculaceae bacterium]